MRRIKRHRERTIYLGRKTFGFWKILVISSLITRIERLTKSPNGQIWSKTLASLPVSGLSGPPYLRVYPRERRSGSENTACYVDSLLGSFDVTKRWQCKLTWDWFPISQHLVNRRGKLDTAPISLPMFCAMLSSCVIKIQSEVTPLPAERMVMSEKNREWKRPV